MTFGGRVRMTLYPDALGGSDDALGRQDNEGRG